MVWERDPNVPYPSIWRKFQVKLRDSDEIYKFQVQDATDDMIPDILELMFKFFVSDEPVAKCFDLVNKPDSIQLIKGFYTGVIQGRTALVCVKVDEDGSKTVVGCNMTYVSEPNFDFSEVVHTKELANYVSLFQYLEKESNLYEKFNVTHVLKAAGLAVDRKYRRLGIATEILNARTELCQALKIPLTATEFTSAGGQGCARKAGFHLLLEKKYADVMKVMPELPLENITHPMTQLMYKKIDL